MISDTLWEAINEIKEYLKELDYIYSDSKDELEDLLMRMEKMRVKLDSLPGGE